MPDRNERSPSGGPAQIQALIDEAIDSFAAALEAKAQQRQAGLSAREIRQSVSDFKLSEPQLKLVDAIWQRCINQAEAAQWMESREFHLERMLVKCFSQLLPAPGDKLQQGKHLSRRIIPGVLVAFEQMLGEDKHSYFSARAAAIVQSAEQAQNRRLSWNDIYDNPACDELTDDVLIFVSPYFADITRRRNWLTDVIDAHLPATQDDHEKIWNFGDAEFHVLMNALYGDLRTQLRHEGTAAALAERYNAAELEALQTLFKGLIDDFKTLQKNGFV